MHTGSAEWYEEKLTKGEYSEKGLVWFKFCLRRCYLSRDLRKVWGKLGENLGGKCSEAKKTPNTKALNCGYSCP